MISFNYIGPRSNFKLHLVAKITKQRPQTCSKLLCAQRRPLKKIDTLSQGGFLKVSSLHEIIV